MSTTPQTPDFPTPHVAFDAGTDVIVVGIPFGKTPDTFFQDVVHTPFVGVARVAEPWLLGATLLTDPERSTIAPIAALDGDLVHCERTTELHAAIIIRASLLIPGSDGYQDDAATPPYILIALDTLGHADAVRALDAERRAGTIALSDHGTRLRALHQSIIHRATDVAERMLRFPSVIPTTFGEH